MEFLNRLALSMIEYFSGNYTAVFALALLLAIIFAWFEFKYG